MHLREIQCEMVLEPNSLSAELIIQFYVVTLQLCQTALDISHLKAIRIHLGLFSRHQSTHTPNCFET